MSPLVTFIMGAVFGAAFAGFFLFEWLANKYRDLTRRLREQHDAERAQLMALRMELLRRQQIFFQSLRDHG